MAHSESTRVYTGFVGLLVLVTFMASTDMRIAKIVVGSGRVVDSARKSEDAGAEGRSG